MTTTRTPSPLATLRRFAKAAQAAGLPVPKTVTAQIAALEAAKVQARAEAAQRAAARKADPNGFFQRVIVGGAAARAERKARKAERAATSPAPAKSPYFSASRVELVADGSPGAIAELARRGRGPDGRKVAAAPAAAAAAPAKQAA